MATYISKISARFLFDIPNNLGQVSVISQERKHLVIFQFRCPQKHKTEFSNRLILSERGSLVMITSSPRRLSDQKNVTTNSKLILKAKRSKISNALRFGGKPSSEKQNRVFFFRMVTIQEVENEANVYDWQLNFIEKKRK